MNKSTIETGDFLNGLVSTQPASAGQLDIWASNEAANQDNKRWLSALKKIPFSISSWQLFLKEYSMTSSSSCGFKFLNQQQSQ